MGVSGRASERSPAVPQDLFCHVWLEGLDNVVLPRHLRPWLISLLPGLKRLPSVEFSSFYRLLPGPFRFEIPCVITVTTRSRFGVSSIIALSEVQHSIANTLLMISPTVPSSRIDHRDPPSDDFLNHG